RSGARLAAATPLQVSVSTPAEPRPQEFEISAPAAEVSQPAIAAMPETKSPARPVAAPSGLFFHAAPSVAPPPPPSPVPIVAEPEFSVAPTQEGPVEIDLSSEWEQDLTVEMPHATSDAEPPSFLPVTPEAAEA